MAAPKKRGGATAIISTLIGPGIPGGYMAITGHTPTWARAWYGVWLLIGILIIIAKSGRSDA